MHYTIKPLEWKLESFRRNYWFARTVLGLVWVWQKESTGEFHWDIDTQQVNANGMCASIDACKHQAEKKYIELLETALIPLDALRMP